MPGLVNIIPRRIGETGARGIVGHEGVKGQPYRLASGAVTYGFRANGSGVTAYGYYENAAPVDYNGDGYTEPVDRTLAIGGARARLALGSRCTLALDYQHTAEDRRGGNRLDHPELLANIAETIGTRFHRGSASLERRIGDNLDLIGTYVFAVVARDTFYGGPGDVETDPAAPGFDRAALDDAIAVSRNQYGTTDDTLHVAELRGQTTLGAHTLITGVQYRYEKVDDRNVDVNGVFVNQLFKDSFDDLGLFVQDEWNLRDNLCIVLGGRVDCSSEVGSAIFSPRVGLGTRRDQTSCCAPTSGPGFARPRCSARVCTSTRWAASRSASASATISR